MHKIDISVERGIAFYLPIRTDVDKTVRIYNVNKLFYSSLVGPIPLEELTSNIPDAITQIPKLAWGDRSSMSSRSNKKSPDFGDMIVCIKKTGAVTLGFFTCRAFSDDFIQKFPFVIWPGQKTKNINHSKGFLYLPGSFLDHTIMDDIKERININGYT